jgi:hypothetical protein
MEIAEKYSIIPYNIDHILQIREVEQNKIRVEKVVSITEIKQVKSGYGNSRIALILFDDYDRLYYFNVSNRNLYSDFGGGIKQKETLFEGLVREVREEAPLWQDYLLERVEADYVKCHVVETLFPEKPENNRIEVLVFVTIDISILPLFIPTKEVTSVFTVMEVQVKYWLEQTENKFLNTGLMQFKKYLLGKL